MKRLVVLLALFVALPALAATVTYTKVTTYTDGSAIPAAKIPTMSYQVYTGPSLTGPWAAANSGLDVSMLTAPDPVAGGTLWYTVDVSLDGQTSVKAVAVSKSVPFKAPAAPSGITVQ